MKLIAALLAVCLLATTALAAPMPWKTFSGEMVDDAIQSQMIPCPQGELFQAVFKRNSAGYAMYYNPATNLIVFVYYPDVDALPTEIGFGQVDILKTDEIPPLKWREFTRVERNGLSVCAVLFPNEA